jgi:hypothetical protein
MKGIAIVVLPNRLGRPAKIRVGYVETATSEPVYHPENRMNAIESRFPEVGNG